MKNYIKGKGILVGEFSADELREKKDKELFKKVAEETGCEYANVEIKKNKMRVYACTFKDCWEFK